MPARQRRGVSAERVAEPVRGADEQRRARPVAECLANLGHEVREIGLGHEGPRPETFDEHVLGYDAWPIQGERRQQVERFRREVNLAIVPGELSRIEVEGEWAEAYVHSHSPLAKNLRNTWKFPETRVRLDAMLLHMLNLTRRRLLLLCAAACVLFPRVPAAQGLTGALIGTVRDTEGGVLPGAAVRVSSPALIGGPAAMTTNDKGQLRFPALPPGVYALDIEMQGFATLHEQDISIGAGAAAGRRAVLKLAGPAEHALVQGSGSRIETRNPGFGTRFGPDDLAAIPTRRSSMFDFVRAAPVVSATSQ